MTRLTFIFLFSSFLVFAGKSYAQTETERWGKKETVSTAATNHTHSVEKPVTLADIMYRVYQEVFSKPDGDKCAFAPSCSSFGAILLNNTNVVSAVLLTGDRLIRDTNLFGRRELYPVKNGKLFDVPETYLLEVRNP